MNEKLAQMLLYVAHRLAGDQWNGKTKIHKILFFSDFEAFRQTGKIAQHRRQKCRYGVPEQRKRVLFWLAQDTKAGEVFARIASISPIHLLGD